MYSFFASCIGAIGFDASRTTSVRPTIAARDLAGLSESSFLAATPTRNLSQHSQSLRSHRPQGAVLNAQGHRRSVRNNQSQSARTTPLRKSTKVHFEIYLLFVAF